MSDTPSKAEQAKGRLKEAAGDLTDNDDLKSEGQLDQASGKVKERVEHAADKAEAAIDHAKDKLRR